MAASARARTDSARSSPPTTAIGALFVIIFSFPFAWLWPKLDKAGLNPSYPAKFAWGLVFCGLSFGVLAFAAASMLYVAVADLIPTLHRRFSLKDTLQQMVMIGLGVATVTLTHSLLPVGH